MHRRRKRWLLGTGVAFGLMVGGGVLALFLTQPGALPASGSVDSKSIPEQWMTGRESAVVTVEDEARPQPPPIVSTTEESESDSASHPAPGEVWTETGALVVKSDGKTFSTEEYRLESTQDGVILSSTGLFTFNALVTIRVEFVQSLSVGSDLHPVAYSLDLDGPLGFGQRVTAEAADDVVRIVRDDKVTTTPVDLTEAFILGTFSTYTLMPYIHDRRNVDGVTELSLLAFGGPPNGPSDSSSTPPPRVVLRDLPPQTLDVEGTGVLAERLQATGPFGDSVLYVKGRELLGLTAEGENGELVAYRSDYFPNGFTLLD